jgi:hypothetical protein
MKEIRINEPGAGQRIMSICGGSFRDDCDHSLATYEDGTFLGGFVLDYFMGNTIAVHDGAVSKRWCSRELMWMLFHYVFVQLKCHKAYAPVPSDNAHALELNLRAGWKMGVVLRDALAPGRHLLLLEIDATGAQRWLRLIPQQYLHPGTVKGLYRGRQE